MVSIQIVHCADIHLDRSFSIPSLSRALERKEDINRNFSEIVNFALSNKPDLFLMSGDVFDRVFPSNLARAFLTSRIRELSDAGISVFTIGGNHDVPKIPTQTSLAIDVLHSAGLATVFSQTRAMQKKVVQIHGESVCISGKSFNTQNINENPLRDYKVPLEGRYNILLIHGSLSGMNVMPSIPEYANQNGFGADDVIDGLDYLALGHYHNFFQRIHKGCQIVNPGSIEKLTWGEMADTKGFIWVELNNSESKIEFHKLQTRPMESVDLELSKDLAVSIDEKITQHLQPLADNKKLVRLDLRGTISQEQYRQLKLNELYKKLREIFFEVTIRRDELEVEGYGRIFLGRVETPLEAFDKRVEKLIAAAEPQERGLLLAVRDLGTKYLEANQ